MDATTIKLYENSTELNTPTQLVRQIITDVGMNRREIQIPCEFQNELKAIQDELKPKKTTITTKILNTLSTTTIISLEIALNFLAITNFGLMPMLSYYFSTPAVATQLAINKTLSQLSIYSHNETPTRIQITPINNNTYTYPLLMINFAESLAALLPFSTQSINLSGQFSKRVTVAKIELAFHEYVKSLSPERIDAAIPSEYLTPAKSGFSDESKNDYLVTNIEIDIVRYVRHSMRQLARIIAEELPREITIEPTLSWVQTGIRQLQRLLQPITIPYQILTKRGYFNPIKSQLETAKRAITESDQTACEDESRKSELLSNMVKHAKVMYRIEQERQMIVKREASHKQILADQEKLIQQQEARIRSLQNEIDHHQDKLNPLV